jgi:hypothetical protein
MHGLLSFPVAARLSTKEQTFGARSGSSASFDVARKKKL